MTTCECGKVRYLNRREAKQRARALGSRTGKVRTYHCDGGFWHLTSVTAEATTFFRTQRTEGSA